MDISSGLIAKGAAGALAASAAVGTGVAANKGWLDGFFKTNIESVDAGEAEKPHVEEEPTSNLSVDISEQHAQLPEGEIPGQAKTVVSEPSLHPVVDVNDNPDSGRAKSQVTSDDADSSSQNNDLTKFDQGLINFLESGGDIVFDVKKANGTDDFTVADLDLNNSNPLPLTAKISVSVNESNRTKLIEKADNTDDKGKTASLQKLNGADDVGTPWTWTCEITFAGNVTPPTGKSINDKDRIFKATDKGLFGILKKDFSSKNNDGAKEKGKKTKEKFIRVCAKERKAGKNKTIEDSGILSSDQNNLKSEITINLKSGSSNQKSKADDKLYPSSESDKNMFKELFDKVVDQTTTN